MPRLATPWLDELRGKDFLPDRDDWLGPDLRQAVASLSRRQKEVMFLRYVREVSQAEAAEILGVVQQRVSALEKSALGQIRTILSSRNTSKR